MTEAVQLALINGIFLHWGEIVSAIGVVAIFIKQLYTDRTVKDARSEAKGANVAAKEAVVKADTARTELSAKLDSHLSNMVPLSTDSAPLGK